MLVYKDGHIESQNPRLPAEEEIVWLHLDNPKKHELEDLLQDLFGCHPLAIEDALHFKQRPKIDHYADLRYPQSFISFYEFDEVLGTNEFCIILAKQFLITVTKSRVAAIESTYQHLQNNPEFMETTGRLLYHLLDHCVDGYLDVTHELENRLNNLELRVVDHPEERIAPVIFGLKQDVQRLRRIASDATNVIGELGHESFPYTANQHAVYFADVRDHLSRVVNELDAARDHSSNLLTLQTSQRANQMNEVMKTLTVISTIFLPLSFIVGLYGMNFKDIPELSWPFGYIYVWGLMIIVSAGFIVYFRRKKWW